MKILPSLQKTQGVQKCGTSGKWNPLLLMLGGWPVPLASFSSARVYMWLCNIGCGFITRTASVFHVCLFSNQCTIQRAQNSIIGNAVGQPPMSWNAPFFFQSSHQWRLPRGCFIAAFHGNHGYTCKNASFPSFRLCPPQNQILPFSTIIWGDCMFLIFHPYFVHHQIIHTSKQSLKSK